MPDFNAILNEQNQTTETLSNLINQFYRDPARMEESRALIDAQADQAFSDVTGQFRDAGRQTQFEQARRGLAGGSVQQEQLGALNRAFQRQAGNIEAQRQGALQQAQMSLEMQRQQALQQAYQQDQFGQGALQALLSAQGQQAQNVQQAGLGQQALMNLPTSAGVVSGGLGSGLNLLAQIFSLQNQARG